MTKRLTYTILLRSSAQDLLLNLSCIQFCQTLIQAGHSIQCLFMQNEAVYLGSNNYVIPEDELDLALKWHKFAAKNNIPAYLCTNSTLRRGILDDAFAIQYKKQANLTQAFVLAPLGVLFKAIESSDRYLQL